MSHLPRPQNRVYGPATLSEKSEENTGGGTASRTEQIDNPQPSEGDQSRGGQSNSPLNYPSRSPFFRTFSRSSSGYFSFDYDSVPSSPLMTHNKSTQTPSPTCQVITHALQRMSQVQDSGQNHDVWAAVPSRYRAHTPPPVGDMQPEVCVGRELRRIGDEFNHLYLQGARAGRNGEAAPAGLQQGQNEPALLLWVGLLIGRLLQIILRRR
ncbi:bcl-2-like protein 11 [Chanos chanos]|uniref:Bcl-2-like protein 11 n=1 Tax=Chanos chanos TaxID=29144 RepID=A0A6J2V773_CHACN|nr:bcl-2-like protein 11 [Chanos chanos]